MVLRAPEIEVGRSLAKTMRRGAYTVRLDTAFRDVVEACAAVPRPGQDGTWITAEMIDAYVELHRRGVAHSAEAFRDGQLAGGLYGVSLGGAFFGESMFAEAPDASKVAFVTLVRQLERWGIDLVDCQVRTEHLARFGASEWPPRPLPRGARGRARQADPPGPLAAGRGGLMNPPPLPCRMCATSRSTIAGSDPTDGPDGPPRPCSASRRPRRVAPLAPRPAASGAAQRGATRDAGSGHARLVVAAIAAGGASGTTHALPPDQAAAVAIAALPGVMVWVWPAGATPEEIAHDLAAARATLGEDTRAVMVLRPGARVLSPPAPGRGGRRGRGRGRGPPGARGRRARRRRAGARGGTCRGRSRRRA